MLLFGKTDILFLCQKYICLEYYANYFVVYIKILKME